MKKQILLLVAMMLSMTLSAEGKNVKTTMTQVTENISLEEDEDLVVTGTAPFSGNAQVNIVNTEHAVLILERLKPSKVTPSMLAQHVLIGGQPAHNGSNCQVRLYGTMGSMILPYAADQPLTVYSEPDFGGEQCSDFSLENDGGYMVTLSDAKLNNRIRSFKLKRGYMVTFATQQSGYGYQRCFIANDQDVEMASLPQILDQKISSYRIFRWNTAGKKGLASSTDASTTDALNVISCYGWDAGHNMYPDVECVANHLYEDYPSSATCGRATWTSHMKTNNEPLNQSDDKPQSLNTILANWQNLMRTGMRLCSPSSWDGSDHTDGSGFLKQFFDSIDARGWRCDIADLHCYWLIDNFNNLGTMQSKYKRPLWISEWIWGASWNKNGAFESGKTDGDIAWAVKQICEKLNSYGYVERYFYWNSESKGKLYNNGSLTQAGQYYSTMLSGMGYNSRYEKIPNTPRMRGGFRDFHVTTEDGKAVITWHDYDGEYNQLMEVLRKKTGEAWQTWKNIRPEDAEADYAITDEEWTDGTRYRLHIRSFSGRDYYSSQDLEPGEAIEMTDGTLRYAGGNVIPNGQFRMGLSGWTSGTGQPLGQPWFQVFPQSLSDGYFLQAFANQGKDGEGSLKTAFAIEPQQDYLLRMASQNAGNYVKLDVRSQGESTDANRVTMKNSTYWQTQQAIFNSGTYNEALLAFRWLGATAQMGDIELCRLFNTREEAVADGVEQARRRALFATQWNTTLPALNEELLQRVEAVTTTGDDALAQIGLAVDDLLQAVSDRLAIDSLMNVAQAVINYHFPGREQLLEAMEQTAQADQATAEQMGEMRQELQTILNGFLVMEPGEVQPQSPLFASTDGWQTKVGTFTGGDQRTATQEGLTCWNAWWSGIDASQGKEQTMEIRQTIDGLPEGLYALQCKASTQHYCLSDQHGYLSTDGEQAVTPTLSRDYLDVPSTTSAWQTLTSTPVYVAPGETLTIGFTGSKDGAVNNAWRRYGEPDNAGDKREGWWCATDFKLLYHPIFRFATKAGQWSTICLPYEYLVPQGAKVYEVAGLLSDYSQICLEEVTEPQQGYPYVYLSEAADVTFYTYGEALKSPVRRGTNNLYGTFISVGYVPEGSYWLGDDGEWYRTTIDNRPRNIGYTAVIRKAEGLPLFETWDGITLPIHNVVDELGDPDGIAKNKQDVSSSSYYTLGGQHSSSKPAGIHISVSGKKARKVLR